MGGIEHRTRHDLTRSWSAADRTPACPNLPRLRQGLALVTQGVTHPRRGSARSHTDAAPCTPSKGCATGNRAASSSRAPCRRSGNTARSDAGFRDFLGRSGSSWPARRARTAQFDAARIAPARHEFLRAGGGPRCWQWKRASAPSRTARSFGQAGVRGCRLCQRRVGPARATRYPRRYVVFADVLGGPDGLEDPGGAVAL